MYEYKGFILKVVDGDTVDVSIDLGFTVWVNQRVRLEGLNAPERYTTEGKASMAYLQSRLPEGLVVTLRSKKPSAGDKYGRYLATIVVGQLSINEDLIAHGHAVPWDGQGVKPV